MRCLYRTLIVVISLNVTSIGRTDEPAAAGSRRPAWPALEWKMAVPSPFKRVESPTAVVNGKLYLFGGFTEDLQASNQVDVFDPILRLGLEIRRIDIPPAVAVSDRGGDTFPHEQTGTGDQVWSDANSRAFVLSVDAEAEVVVRRRGPAPARKT